MRKERVPKTTRDKIGRNLKTSIRGSQLMAAPILQVTTRTLRNWKKNADKPTKDGRKVKQIKFNTAKLILLEWKKQGKPGWRPINVALTEVPTRQIQFVIGKIKKREIKKQNHVKSINRNQIKTFDTKTILTIDGAADKDGVNLIITRDRCSMETNIQRCEGNLKSEDVLNYLEGLKLKNNLPLVLASDNGSPFCSQMIAKFLDENQIIHLRSLPHVPQHNGVCEAAVKEVKTQINNGKTIEETLIILNHHRLRKKHNWLSVNEFLKSASTKINIRNEFYEATKKRIFEYCRGIESAYEVRKAEREAILDTLENFELIKQTRGRSITLPIWRPFCEAVN
jgi:hypothetical protein